VNTHVTMAWFKHWYDLMNEESQTSKAPSPKVSRVKTSIMLDPTLQKILRLLSQALEKDISDIIEDMFKEFINDPDFKKEVLNKVKKRVDLQQRLFELLKESEQGSK